MRTKIKVIGLSMVIVLFFNVLVFGIFTLVQAPYYSDAPDKIDSVYDAIAGDTNSHIVCYSGEGFGKNDEITHYLRSLSVTKLNPLSSYFVLLTCTKNDYVLYAYNWLSTEEKISAKNNLLSDIVVIYIKNDVAYFVFKEFAGATYTGKYKKVAVYKLIEPESIQALNAYKVDGGSAILFPEWRSDISRIDTSLRGKKYVSSVFLELVISMFVINRFIGKNNRLLPTMKNNKRTSKESNK